MSEKKGGNVYLASSIEAPKIDKFRKGIRVQFVNENLEDAIKQIKQSIKNKSKSNLMTGSVVDSQTNPQKNNQNQGKSQRLFFTQEYKKKMDQRLFQIQERKKELNARSLQKQMKARLLRKIQENIKLKQKMDILKDLQQHRQMLLTERSQREKRKKEQQQMLHDSSRVNAEMSRKSKRKLHKKQLKLSRVVQQESHKDLLYKNYLSQKSKQERQILLASRHELLQRNNSAQNFRVVSIGSRTTTRNSTLIISRPIRTSQAIRQNGYIRNGNGRSEEDEQLIIQQYKHTKNENNAQGTQQNDNESQSKTVKQKKYNLTVRQVENQPRQNTQEQADTVEML